MFSQIVGPVTLEAALVLVVLFGGLCIIITTMIAKRRSAKELSNEHELAKIKQADDNTRALYALETERGYKFKQVDQGLITSHARQE